MTSASAPTAENLHARLQHRLAATALQVIDESHQHAGHVGANDSGVGTHFRVRIASPLFAGKSRVACHRLVYDAVQDFIDQGLHALAIETENTPSALP
ncbi:MAG: BolA family transcriptional regulator [Rhodoferax sp.]|jgi:BolA protein|nr:BolA family transcriptional regulator [Rhodoferax sp.]